VVRTTKKGKREMRGRPGGIFSLRKMDKVKRVASLLMMMMMMIMDDDPYLPESIK